MKIIKENDHGFTFEAHHNELMLIESLAPHYESILDKLSIDPTRIDKVEVTVTDSKILKNGSRVNYGIIFKNRDRPRLSDLSWEELLDHTKGQL
jgi:hypothetical protein